MRVLSWFLQKYKVNGEVSRDSAEEMEYEDLSALFAATHPKTDVERVLAACYFRNQVLREADIDTRTITGDLRQMGQNVGNVSGAMHNLNVGTPSFLVVVSKEKGAHKRFRITSAGIKYVRDLISRESAGAGAQ